MINKKIFLYVMVGVLIFGLLVFTFFPKVIYAIKDIRKSESNSSDNEDICRPPADSGISEEDWKIHMSHHQNIYGDCLN